MGRDIEWESEQYLLGRCANCATADERVREARREVWEKAWLLLHETVIPAGEPRSFIEKDRRRLVAAFNKARAAEGE